LPAAAVRVERARYGCARCAIAVPGTTGGANALGCPRPRAGAARR
jgi:hypothetical protein